MITNHKTDKPLVICEHKVPVHPYQTMTAYFVDIKIGENQYENIGAFLSYQEAETFALNIIKQLKGDAA